MTKLILFQRQTIVESVAAVNSLQLYLYAFLSYVQHSRCCDIPKLDVCEHLTNWQYATLTMSFRANMMQSFTFMYCFVSLISTNSLCHKKYTGIFISGKDMNATSFAGAILDAIFDLALKM